MLFKLMKSSGTHSWVSLGSWKAFTGIWLMRFRLSLRTCRVEPRWSRAPSSNALILLLLRYLKTETAQCVKRRVTNLKHAFMNHVHCFSFYLTTNIECCKIPTTGITEVSSCLILLRHHIGVLCHCNNVKWLAIVLTGLWFGGLQESSALWAQWCHYCSGPGFPQKPALWSACRLYCGSYYDVWKKEKKKKLHKMPHKRALGVVEDHTHRPITLPYKVSTSLFLKIWPCFTSVSFSHH